MKEFKTERLSCKSISSKLTTKDVKGVYNLMNNVDTVKYSTYARLVTIHETCNFIKELRSKISENHFIMYNLNNQFIGLCNFTLIKYKDTNMYYTSIGYYIKPEFTGLGYATEVAKELINISFKEYNVYKVIATCDPRNKGSEKVMSKIGLTFDGWIKADKLLPDGTWRDSLLYSMTRKDWLTSGGV